jgi:hypothetical protein
MEPMILKWSQFGFESLVEAVEIMKQLALFQFFPFCIPNDHHQNELIRGFESPDGFLEPFFLNRRDFYKLRGLQKHVCPTKFSFLVQPEKLGSSGA